MYMKKMVEVGKVDNGYVIECRVPMKPEETKGKKSLEAYPGSLEKQYVAEDLAGVIALFGKVLPMLDDTFSSEEEFEAAFHEAAGK